MSYAWNYTHVSVDDGSPARLVGYVSDGFVEMENEDGDRWFDLESDWAAVEDEAS